MSSPPPENLIIVNLMPTFGAVLVGSFLSAAVWGVSTFQTFLYFMTYDSDPLSLKALVAFLWALDTLNEVLILKSNFRVDILRWGKVGGLNEQQLELMDHTVVEAVVTIIVQLYFIRRIYLFGKKKWLLPACLAILSSWQIVGDIVYQIYGYGRLISTLSTPREVALNISLRAAAVAVDIAVAISMVYLLTVTQPKSQFTRSRVMVQRLLMLSVNSGMITAITASATLILLAALPTTLYYCVPELILCSLYFSTFLANLNARRYVRGDQATNTFSSVLKAPHSNMVALRNMNHGGRSMSVTKGGDESPDDSEVVVKIESETHVGSDAPYASKLPEP